MKLNKKIFNNLEKLNDDISQNFDFSLEIDSDEDDMDFELIETENSLIVGFISIDHDSKDYWESSDGLGEFTEFRNQTHVNEIMGKLNKSTKLFYLVDKYDHSSVHYSVAQSSAYPDQRWDVSHNNSVIVPCDDIQSQYKKYKKEHGAAAAFKHFIADTNLILDGYSKCCNGENFGYQIKVFDKNGNETQDEACWGYIGSDYANQEKSSAMDCVAINEEVKNIAKNVNIDSLSKEEIKELPFKILRKGFLEGKIAKVYEDIIISAKYEGDDKSFVYQWNPSQDKVSIAKFEQWQKDHGTTPEQFLAARMRSEINSSIRAKLKNESNLETTTTLKI